MMAVGTKTQSRRRCDSPAPCTEEPAATTPTKSKCNETAPTLPSPLLSMAAVGAVAAVVCGFASYLEDLTHVALGTFVTMGAAVMHFDFIEMAKEEAEKNGQSALVSLRIGLSGQRWLFFTSSSVLLLGILLASRTATDWIVSTASSLLETGGVATACARHVQQAPHWRTAVQWSDEAAIFVASAVVVVGLAMSRLDFMDLLQQENETASIDQGPPSAEKPLKGGNARSQWRVYAFSALLLAAVASVAAEYIPLLLKDM